MTAAAGEITAAVRAWLDGLDDAQRAAATFPFDTTERFVWAYTPGPAGGPRAPGHAPRPAGRRERDRRVVDERAGPPARSPAIIALETVLGELERADGRSGWSRRDPELYWFAVFGEPGAAAPWSWRIGGHHVAIHLTLADGRVIGTTPSFLGANPAVVPGGAAGGDTDAARRGGAGARRCSSELTPDERRVAIVDDRAPADILTGTGRRADLRSVPIGIRHADLGAAAAGGARATDPLLRRPRPAGGRATRPGQRIVAAGLARSRSPGQARRRPAAAITTRSAGRASSSSTTTPRTAQTTSTRSGATSTTTGARTSSRPTSPRPTAGRP